MYLFIRMPIPVVERSKAIVYGRSLAGIAGWEVEVSATGRSLVQRCPTDCVVSLCVVYKLQEWGGHGPHWAVAPEKEFTRINVVGVSPEISVNTSVKSAWRHISGDSELRKHRRAYRLSCTCQLVLSTQTQITRWPHNLSLFVAKKIASLLMVS